MEEYKYNMYIRYYTKFYDGVINGH
jgi:hypothetical protein